MVAAICLIYGVNTAAAEDNGGDKESDSLANELISRLENIKNMTGVDIRLAARSEFNKQRIIMNHMDTTWSRPNEESEAFNEADVIIEARPVKGISAKGVIRMRTDWTSFF
jgi:hypothetical protein